MKNYLLLLGIALLLLTGCGTTGMIKADKEVREGMTFDEVQAMLGKPLARSFERGIEEWTYFTEKVYPEVNITRVIVFEKGRVVSMQSFTEPRKQIPVKHTHPKH